MEVCYEPSLLEYMEKKKLSTILVELVEINNSDLDVTEFHVRLVNRRLRDLFVDQKRYRVVTTPQGEVLLPPFPLVLEDAVTFGLKKVLFVSMLTYKGIKV